MRKLLVAVIVVLVVCGFLALRYAEVKNESIPLRTCEGVYLPEQVVYYDSQTGEVDRKVVIEVAKLHSTIHADERLMGFGFCDRGRCVSLYRFDAGPSKRFVGNENWVITNEEGLKKYLFGQALKEATAYLQQENP